MFSATARWIAAALAFSFVATASLPPPASPEPECLRGLTDEDLLRRARDFAAALVAKIPDGTRTVDLIPNSWGRIRLEVYGVPAWVTPIAPTGIFRHHIRDHADAEAEILRTRRLLAGYTPYVKSDYPVHWYKETFKDLTGIFLTRPGVDPEKIGLLDSTGPFVDVELFPDTPVIEIERGRIYLIPGPPKVLAVPVLPVRREKS